MSALTISYCAFSCLKYEKKNLEEYVVLKHVRNRAEMRSFSVISAYLYGCHRQKAQ